uniref:Uncharacterized protein n=1 Tax=Panagrolaimus sp. JU765 TaxID=591449 RepID=A0AC34RSQ0_9BILA
MLMNPKMKLETDLISLNESHEYEILVKCFDGSKRITTVTILGAFLKSILNLLEQNLGEEVKEIRWTAPNFCKETMDKVFESLKIVAKFKNGREILNDEKSTPNVTGYCTNEIYSTTMAVKELSIEPWRKYWKNNSRFLATHEENLNEYMSCESNANKIVEKIYDREFIELKREINKLFSLVECPLSVEELKRFGIDRMSVLQSIKQKSGIISNKNPS